MLRHRWQVHNRRIHRLPCGAAESPDGRVRGFALRLNEAEAGQWTVRWANATTGIRDLRATGEFWNERGAFSDPDTHEGRSLLLRFARTLGKFTGTRWKGASSDAGATRETNWSTAFKRPADRNPPHEASNGS